MARENVDTKGFCGGGAGQPPSQEQINIGSPWKRPGQTGWLAAAAAAGCAL